MTYVYETDRDKLEVINAGPFININIENHGDGPDSTYCCSIVVPKADVRRVITNLAQATGYNVAISSPEETPCLIVEAVKVIDNTKEVWYTAGENKYTVEGDIDDILTDEEFAQLQERYLELDPDGLSHSPNYMVANLFRTTVNWSPLVSLDPEHSCFFGYTNERAIAGDLAAWINGKEFLK